MISKRIKLIASLIKDNESVADIGCDHGYLAKQLRENGNSQLLLCADEKYGPILNAKKNLSNYENILYYQTDGLNGIKQTVDVIVIAGMGTNTIIHILEEGEDYLRNIKRIILQPNNEVAKLRKWIVNNNYKIVNENIILDYKYYQIITIETGQQDLNIIEEEYGPCLLTNRDECFIEYLNYLLKKYQEILSRISIEDDDHSTIKGKIDEIKYILKN